MENERSYSEQQEQISATIIDLTRHGNRFGGKMKVMIDGQPYEFDDGEQLTSEGRERSKNFGMDYDENVVLVHPRGASLRHGQTGQDILEGSGKIGPSREKAGKGPARIIAGEKVIGSRKGAGLDYKESGISDEVMKKVKTTINTKLNDIIQKLSLQEQQEFLKSENGALRAKYREIAQLKGLDEIMKDKEAVKIAAENEALELLNVIRISRRGVKPGPGKVAIPDVGSGMFAEAMFKYALVQEDEETGEKKVGYDDVSEIGGFTKQATAFRIIAKRDAAKGIKSDDLEHFEEDTDFQYEFTDPERAKILEGKKIYLDWDKVRELAKGAEKRFEK